MFSHSVCFTHPPSTKGLRTSRTKACFDPPLRDHSPGITTSEKEMNHTQSGKTKQILKEILKEILKTKCITVLFTLYISSVKLYKTVLFYNQFVHYSYYVSFGFLH